MSSTSFQQQKESELSASLTDYVCTFIIGLCTMIMMIILIDFIKSVYYEQKAIPEKIKYLTTCTLIFFNTMSVCTEIGLIYILITYHNVDEGVSYILTRFGIFSWFIALYLMLTTYAFRIHNSFRSSFLRLSKKMVKILFFLCFILILLGICITIFIILKLYHIKDILAVFCGIFYVILSILLMRLFIKRIDRVMLGKFTHLQIVNNDMIQTIIDNDLIDLFIRNAVLTSISICSSFIGIVTSIIFGKFDNNDTRYPIFGFLSIVLTGTINAISMYLSFRFNINIYNKLCGPLHKLCKKYKVNQIASKQSWDKKRKQTFSKSILLETECNE